MRSAEGPILSANTWSHLAATYDGTALRLFVNGAQAATTTVSGAIVSSNGVLQIGGNRLLGTFFQGRIDEVRIYNRALSAAEIQRDMNVAIGATGVPPDAPQSLTAVVTGTSVTLNWIPPTTGGVPGSYGVEVSLAAGGLPVAAFPVAETSLTVPNVPHGVYYARVRALNDDGQSAPSNEILVGVPEGTCASAPNAPQALTATVVGPVVTLNWSPPAGGCQATHYVIEARSLSGAAISADVGMRTTLTVSAPPGTYFVRVIAVNTFGVSSVSNEVVVTVE